MKKWYKTSYFNSKNWLLENFDKLGVSSEELVILLLILLAKENGQRLNYEFFSEKMKLKNKDLDKLFSMLIEKRYLQISTDSEGLVFDVDGIFEFDPEQYEISENLDLYDVLASVFGRPLSSTELQKVSDLVIEFGEDKFNYAVREAEAYRKLNLSYIEAILRNND